VPERVQHPCLLLDGQRAEQARHVFHKAAGQQRVRLVNNLRSMRVSGRARERRKRRTRIRSVSVRRKPASMSARRRPGVPTTIWQPRRRRAPSSSSDRPPTKAWHFTWHAVSVQAAWRTASRALEGKSAHSAASVRCVCSATSRVGSIISACGACTSRLTQSAKIAPKVTVLPVPDLACSCEVRGAAAWVGRRACLDDEVGAKAA